MCRRSIRLERDDFSSNRHPALGYCWSMIFSENRYPLFGIMLQQRRSVHRNGVTDLDVERVPGVSGVEALVAKAVLPDEAGGRLIIDDDAIESFADAGRLLRNSAIGLSGNDDTLGFGRHGPVRRRSRNFYGDGARLASAVVPRMTRDLGFHPGLDSRRIRAYERRGENSNRGKQDHLPHCRVLLPMLPDIKLRSSIYRCPDRPNRLPFVAVAVPGYFPASGI